LRPGDSEDGKWGEGTFAQNLPAILLNLARSGEVNFRIIPERENSREWAYEFDFLGTCNILGTLIHTMLCNRVHPF